MAISIEPGDAYQLLALIAEQALSSTLAERTIAQAARMALPPEQTPAGQQLAALHRLAEQLLPLAFTDQARPLTLDGEPAGAGDASPPAEPSPADRVATAAHRHPGLLPSQCPECTARLTAAGAR